MARAEFGIAQRQIPVRAQIAVEYLDMTRAVHRLDRVIALFRLRGKHQLVIVFPVAGFLPQRAIHHLRGADFLIAMHGQHAAHVLLDRLPQTPALRVPENHARRFVLHVEEIELLTQLAVIALLSLFQHVQVLVEIFLLRPSSAVNTLQHFILAVTAPVSTRHLHQLEDFELAS